MTIVAVISDRSNLTSFRKARSTGTETDGEDGL
jgi:hypothetical protein